jgi:hypothetical protein
MARRRDVKVPHPVALRYNRAPRPFKLKLKVGGKAYANVKSDNVIVGTD